MSTDVSDVRAASIIRAILMEAARTSEPLDDIQLRTRQYIPEDSELNSVLVFSAFTFLLTSLRASNKVFVFSRIYGIYGFAQYTPPLPFPPPPQTTS
jgi:hypothetical protein